MIVIIEGKINSGKTLLLAKLTKDRMQETDKYRSIR
jgi:Ni2+-binding GTPase involved in maturation of urease and hydrogenase